MLRVHGQFMKMIYLTHNINIRNKILVFVCTFVIIFAIIVGYFTFKKVEGIVNHESGNSMQAILTQVNNSIDYNIKESEVSINSFYSGSRIKSLIASDPDMLGGLSAYLSEIKQQIFTLKSVNDNVTDLRIFSFNENINWADTSVYSTKEMANPELLKALTEDNENGAFYWTNAGDSTWNKFSYVPVIYCYKTVFNAVNNQPLAVLRIDVVSENIFKAINSVTFGKSGVIFVAKENGNLVYFNKNSKQPIGDFKERVELIVQSNIDEGAITVNVGGRKEFLVFSKRNKLGWYVIGAIPSAEITEKANDIRSFIITVSLMVSLFVVTAAFLFSYALTKRIGILSVAINRFGKGDFEVGVDVAGNDEIGQMAHQFKIMMRRIKELMHESEVHYIRESELLNEKYELEILRKEAELSALQTQINPHFLYNTLETMKGLLFTENYRNNMINAIQALSGMFRYNLHSGSIVKIKAEVKHITDYLTIQNFRFDFKIYLHMNIAPEILESEIVRVTFEPIVENAIIHGFRGAKSDKHLYLHSVVNGEQLLIMIEDNGIGIEKEKCDSINQLLSAGEYNFKSERKGGLGIYNVNARLKKHYGNEYGLRMESIQGEGTKVLINLPMNEIRY